MTVRSYNDTKHWRDRAIEMRALSHTVKDAGAAAIMLGLAEDYDKLAERVDICSNRGTPPASGVINPIK